MSDDEVWTKYKNEFASVYEESNYSSPFRSWIMRSGHKMLEKKIDKNKKFNRVIEIGAGTGEHPQFVRHRFEEYLLCDLNGDTLEIARKKLNYTAPSKYTFDVQSGAKLTFDDNTFDRLIASHVLEHITDPHLAIKEWIRVVKNGGVISVLIPTDPGIAWRLGRHLGPRNDALKRGIPYDYIMAREHVNSCNNLIALLRFYLEDSSEGWWPLPIASMDLNLFFVFHGTVKKGGSAK